MVFGFTMVQCFHQLGYDMVFSLCVNVFVLLCSRCMFVNSEDGAQENSMQILRIYQ